MAIAQGNKRVAATLDPIRQERLNMLLENNKSKNFTRFVSKWIDQEYHKMNTEAYKQSHCQKNKTKPSAWWQIINR